MESWRMEVLQGYRRLLAAWERNTKGNPDADEQREMAEIREIIASMEASYV